MSNRIFARTKDEDVMGKLIDLMGKDKGKLEFAVDYQEKTESFVFDIKTESNDCKTRIDGYIKQVGITDTKSVGLIGGK
jgi:hypothetical protein